MASRAFHDLLLHSRENLSRNGRGTFMMAVSLLVFHLLVITPFADAGRRKVDAAADRQRLASVGPGLESIGARLETAQGASMAALRPALEELTEQLALDFARLEASRWRWQEERALEAGGEDPGDSGEPGGTAPVAGLEMASPPRGTVPLDIDEGRRRAFAQAPNRYALLSLLEPLVEAEILAPRLAALERAWKTDALPPLISDLEAVGGEISQLRNQFPEAETSWDPLSAALAELTRQAQAWSPQVPKTPFWWASAESEPRLALGLGDHRESLRRPPRLADLEATQQQVRERLRNVYRTWERRQAEIPAADATDGGFLGLDLDGLSPLFPLALGLLLAAAGWRRSRLLVELAKAVQAAVQQGSPAQLKAWFGGQVAPAQPSTASLERLAGSAQLRLWPWLLMSWGWIALAGYQLYGQPTAEWRPWLPALVGAGLVLLATVHRSFVLRKAFALLGDGVVGTTPDFEPEDEPPMADENHGEMLSPVTPQHPEDSQHPEDPQHPEDLEEDLVETTLRR